MRVSIIFVLLVAFLHAAPSDYEKRIVKRMTERYDLKAVSSFLVHTILDHPTIEGVPVDSTKLDKDWRFEAIDPPSRMRSGDWVIWDQKDEDENFDLYYQFDATHTLTLKVKRLARDRFKLLWSSVDEWAILR